MTSVYVAEPPVEQISGERDTDLSTKSSQERYLVHELGCSYPQAKALIRAFERDVADADRIGNKTSRSDASFIAWLMEQVPGGRKPRIRRFAVGDPGWRTS